MFSFFSLENKRLSETAELYSSIQKLEDVQHFISGSIHNWLPTCSRVFLARVTFDNLPAFYGDRMLVIVLTKNCSWSPFPVRWIQSATSHLISSKIRVNITITSTLMSSSVCAFQVSQWQFCMHFSSLSCALHDLITSLSLSWSCNIWRRMQIMICSFCLVIPSLSDRNILSSPVLRLSQTMSFPQWEEPIVHMFRDIYYLMCPAVNINELEAILSYSSRQFNPYGLQWQHGR
jgi:hypothetical protein